MILSKSAQDILNERARQLAEEGWTADHDDRHDQGELARAAGCYALSASIQIIANKPGALVSPPPSNVWPWHRDWWKPKSPRADLVRAGALILAEIDRLDRAAASEA